MPVAASGSPVETATRIAEVVGALPDVARLYSGAVGEIATYGTGGPVGGVRIHRDPRPRIGVYIVARYGRPLPDIATVVRDEVTRLLRDDGLEPADAAVNVHIVDLEAVGVPT